MPQFTQPVNGYYNHSYGFWVVCALAPNFLDSTNPICSLVWKGRMSIIGKCCCQKYSFCIPQEFIKFGFASCHCSICRRSHGSPFVLWSGIKSEHRVHFQVLLKDSSLNGLNEIKGSLSHFRTSADCSRYFCGTCGTHLFIDYEKDGSVSEKKSPWEDEIHFPTALLDNESLERLEEVSFRVPPSLSEFDSPFLGCESYEQASLSSCLLLRSLSSSR